MTNKYKPDNWVIIEITVDDETYYKVLAGWSGGYLDGDSWRMNSGIVSVEEDDEYYYFKGFSGSVYKCRKAMETLKLNNGGIANKIEESGSGKVVKYKDIKDKNLKQNNNQTTPIKLKIMKQLEELVNDGYVDLTISKENLIKLIENYGHNIPLLINNKKVWIHFTESDKILVECDISDGSGVELDIEEI